MLKKLSVMGFAALVAAFSLTLTGASPAEAAGEGKSASIPFADLGNIDDWRAWNSRTLYVEAATGQWYKATFFSPCHSVPFAETIAFVTEPDGSLDKFSSILVDGEQCRFRTFEKIDGPPKRDKPE
ncbi:MAG: DUF6491 family protein [Alphaproteobacteria bacterium]|nr:DUF6491 family protein [Alphaproteobacteria bacterium]